MQAVKAYYDGRVFIPTSPVLAKIDQGAIITILDEYTDKGKSNSLLQYAGSLSDDQYAELNDILKDTQRIDYNEW